MTGRMFIKAVVRKAIAAGKATRPDDTVLKLIGTKEEFFCIGLGSICYLSCLDSCLSCTSEEIEIRDSSHFK